LAPKHTLVLATKNRKKVVELRSLLSDLSLTVLSSDEVLGADFDVIEDRDTFEGNAEKKAREVAALCHALCLADDSGLEVDALGGAPGVFSARFAQMAKAKSDTAPISRRSGLEGPLSVDPNRQGPPVDRDVLNNQHLIAELERACAFGEALPTARFRCVLALYDPWTKGDPLTLCEGACEGRIIRQPRGVHGFGYDPHFLLPDLSMTMAELPMAEKSRLSHRGRAFAKLRLLLERILAAREDDLRNLEAAVESSAVQNRSSLIPDPAATK
jgi:XTP/dITP diphosphohydrolase